MESTLSLEQQLDAACDVMEKLREQIAQAQLRLSQSEVQPRAQLFFQHRLSQLEAAYLKHYHFAAALSTKMLQGYAATYKQPAQAA